ncbi:MAG: hypothetical protein ACFNUH_01400 [Bacteroidota bacterium]
MHKKFVSAASKGRHPCYRRLDPTHTRPNPTATEASLRHRMSQWLPQRTITYYTDNIPK